MATKLFIRDQKAIDTALFTSLGSFKNKYKDYEETHDLENIYHSIRKDAAKKAKSTGHQDLKMYIEKQGAENEIDHETKNPLVKVNTSTTITSNKSNMTFNLEKEIADCHTAGFDKPAAIKKELDNKFKVELDLVEVRKIHYKLIGK